MSFLLVSPALAWQDSVPDQTRPRPESFKKPVLIQFHDEINMKSFAYFNRRMDYAERIGADLIIVDIDSPGGLRDQSLEMARRLRDCDWAYTVAIVNDQAISGGALMTLGVDELHVNPNARFGDIGEIFFDAERWAWRLIEPKVESYLSRDARDLAESKGRSADLAEAMIDSDVFVYVREVDDPDGEAGATKKEFKQIRSDAVLKPDPPWQLVPESGPDRFLTVSGQRAIELEIAQGTASTREALAEELNFDLSETTVYKPTVIDSLVYYLQRWWAKFLLIVIGLTALYVELSAPGIGVGGILAGFCAILFFGSSFLGGTAGALEIFLFLSGLAFLAMEIFVIPGFGVSGVLGLLFLLLSVVLAGQDYVVPSTASEINRTFNSFAIIAASGFAFLITAYFVTQKMGSIPIFNQIVLDPGGPETKVEEPEKGVVPIHPTVSVGDWGVADSVLRPAGRVKFAGRTVDVVSDGSFIDPGKQVRVLEISGSVITVTEVDEAEIASHQELDQEAQDLEDGA
ncbi:MAG: NfeD family protein [Planctomycetota bacterium]